MTDLPPPARSPWIAYAVVVVAFILSAAGVISLAEQLVVNALMGGYFLGRWQEHHARAEQARLIATHAAERFIAEGHQALEAGDVPDEAVDELEAQLREAQFALGVLDRFASRRLRLWPPGLVVRR